LFTTTGWAAAAADIVTTVPTARPAAAAPA
jgi:hypothetical protein